MYLLCLLKPNLRDPNSEFQHLQNVMTKMDDSQAFSLRGQGFTASEYIINSFN